MLSSLSITINPCINALDSREEIDILQTKQEHPKPTIIKILVREPENENEELSSLNNKYDCIQIDEERKVDC